jgi:protein-tyrosine phosphatase
VTVTDGWLQVVVHCWQGQGRAGNALASWLVQHHHLPPAEAAEKVLEAARAADASRRVNVAKLQEFADAQTTKP